MMSSDREGLQKLLSHPALLETPDGEHSSAIALVYLEIQAPAAAKTIANLPWVKDGTARV